MKNLNDIGEEMQEAIINSKLYTLAIKLDSDNNQLLAYTCSDSLINHSTEGILNEVNSEIAKKIEQQFNIKLSNFGVSVFDEKISMEDKDYV